MLRMRRTEAGRTFFRSDTASTRMPLTRRQKDGDQMKIRRRSMILAAILAAAVQPASAAQPATLWGTTGTCRQAVPGAPCTQQSTLLRLDPLTGALLETIGPVGYTVNGLAWDRTAEKLYATTAIGDVKFHGLITIDARTGAGTPVDPRVVKFGLPLDASG